MLAMLYGQWRENMATNELQQSEPQNKYKIVDGRMMQGICNQWFLDTNPDLGLEEFAIYSIIARHTFGFRKREGYIEQASFKLNPKTLKKYRDILTEMGIISWQATKKFTLYKILEPQVDIVNFKTTSDRSFIVHEQQASRGSIDKQPIYDPSAPI
jgi:hypothetical protein